MDAELAILMLGSSPLDSELRTVLPRGPPKGFRQIPIEPEIWTSARDVASSRSTPTRWTGPVERDDVRGASTDRTEVGKPGRHLERPVRPDVRDRKNDPRQIRRHGRSFRGRKPKIGHLLEETLI